MRILLRDSDTGEFFKNPDLWLPSPEGATVFPTIERIVHERKNIPRPNLEMLALDEEGRPRFGVRLWRDGEAPFF